MLNTKQNVLRNFWYATVAVEALGDGPKPFKLLGRDKRIANLDSFSFDPSSSGIDHLTDQFVDTSADDLIAVELLGSKIRRSRAPRIGDREIQQISISLVMR